MKSAFVCDGDVHDVFYAGDGVMERRKRKKMNHLSPSPFLSLSLFLSLE